MSSHHVIPAVALAFIVAGANLAQLRTARAQYGDEARVSSSATSREEVRATSRPPGQNVHQRSHVRVSANLTDGGIAPAAPAEPRNGWFTPRCAERDLRAGGAIEEFGRSNGMSTAWLANAGLSWLQARTYCLSGAESEAVALYDRIIAGDPRLASDGRVK